MSPQADQSIDHFVRHAFPHAPHAAWNQGLRLRRVIDASPMLTQMVNENTAADKLNWAVAEDNESLERMATTDGKMLPKVRVPRSLLKPASSHSFDHGPAIFLLGRELHCASKAADIRQSWDDFDRALEAVASSSSTEHDYTSAIEDHLKQIRRHEAMAQASGWDALVSTVQNEQDPNEIHATWYPTWAAIYQRAPRHIKNFIEVDTEGDLSPRFSLARDIFPCVDLENLYMRGARDLDPVGDRYFSGTDGLSHNDNACYNQHAAEAINRAILFEQRLSAPRKIGKFHYMSIDMERLKLLPELVQKYATHRDDLRYPMPYLDQGAERSTYREFRPSSSSIQPDNEPRLDEKSHRNHAMYCQAYTALCEYGRRKWIEKLKQELEPEKRQEKWREAEPGLELELERKLEQKLGLKLEQKLKQVLERKVERGLEPPRLELKKQFEAMQELELRQLLAVKKQLWPELDPPQKQRLELELERKMRQALNRPARSKPEKAVEQREQRLEHRLKQRLEQEKWQREWGKQEAQLEKNLGLDLNQWRKLWRELWQEQWQEHKQELMSELLCPHDQRGKNLAAALVVAACAKDLDRIDQVDIIRGPDGSLKAYAVQSIATPTPVHAQADYPRALFTTIDESSRRWEEQRMRQAWTRLPTPRALEQDQGASRLLSEPQGFPVHRR